MQLGNLGDATRFAPYEIRAPLGRGGMGAVYRAWDPRLQREVALKVLHDRTDTDPDRVRRFVAEARAASALNHPNILTVFDADVSGSTPYIVSELIEGQSLRDEIGRGPLPIKRLLDLGAQIAEGLAEAHAAGIVHRDLKPENIMLTRAGRVKILDFGLAEPTGFRAQSLPASVDWETLTEPGLIAGTLPYMSPEQARGLPTDFRSDQFSLGLILYEMAAGRPAFRRSTPAETLDAIVSDEPMPLTTRGTQTPFLLWWIIERCLAKNPAERYGTTADVSHDLRTLRDRLPEAITRGPAAPAAGRARSWIVWSGFLLLGLALVGAAGIAWRLDHDSPWADLTDLRFRALATSPAYEGLPALSPDGEVVAYSQEVDGVLQIFTRRLTAPSAARVTDCSYDCKYPFWSPDGKRIYYSSLAREKEGIWSIGAAGGSPQVLVENATRAAMSPDGRTVAFLRDDLRADTIGTEALWLSTPEGTAPWSREAVEKTARKYDGFGATRFIEAALAFSPDGQTLGLCVVPDPRQERMWQFWIVPLHGAAEPYRRLQWWSDAGPHISNFSWFPDSRHVALGVASLATAGSHLWIADLQTDRVWPLTRGADTELYPSSAAAGDRVVFTRGESDYDLVQIALKDRGFARPFLATPYNESDPALAPDGKLLAYVTDRNGQDEIWRRSIDGAIDEPLITQRDFGDDRTVMLSSPVFSRDGHHIAYQRNGFKPRSPLRIWISLVEGGTPAPLLPAAYEGIQSAPTWSPDGQWIAFAQWKDREWQLAKVRVGSGEEPVLLRHDGVANATPHWSPAGDWITWETRNGVVLVSPDGAQQRDLSPQQWLAHTWSQDGAEILAIRETEERRLSFIAVQARTKTERAIADLGPSFAVNNPIKGLTLMADGHTVATSLIRPRGDLWMAEGIRWRRPRWRALFPIETP